MKDTTDIEQFAALSTQFFKDPVARMIDLDSAQLSTPAFISKWRPLLNAYAQQNDLKDPDQLAQWVWLVFAEFEINLEDHQH